MYSVYELRKQRMVESNKKKNNNNIKYINDDIKYNILIHKALSNNKML